MQHIGILGGTFDPIHRGHLHLANEVQRLLQLDEIRLIPCYQTVHRDQPIATPEQRLTMVRLACQGFATLRCDDTEYQRGGPSYIIDTLQAIKQHSHAQLYLIVGYDSLIHFKTWKNWQGILDLCHLVVAKRPQYDDHHETALQLMQAYGSTVQTMKTHDHGNITIVEINALAISSTAIRHHIKENEEVKNTLPDSVYQFIKQKGIYEH